MLRSSSLLLLDALALLAHEHLTRDELKGELADLVDKQRAQMKSTLLIEAHGRLSAPVPTSVTAGRLQHHQGLDPWAAKACLGVVPQELALVGMLGTLAGITLPPSRAMTPRAWASASRNESRRRRCRRCSRLNRIAAVAHGFRSSFRDWAAEQTDHPREVIDAALVHVVQNKVEAAYARSDLFERRLLMMNDWADRLGVHAEDSTRR